MNVEITLATKQDLEDIRRLYNEYVLHSTVTFHTEALSTDAFQKMVPVGHAKYKSFRVLLDGIFAGYCCLLPYKDRKAYDRTAEVSVYLQKRATGKGIGMRCLILLEEQAREAGIRVLIGFITADNLVSIRLFEKAGYDKCAHLSQVGEKFGRVLDVVAYQKIL